MPDFVKCFFYVEKSHLCFVYIVSVVYFLVDDINQLRISTVMNSEAKLLWVGVTVIFSRSRRRDSNTFALEFGSEMGLEFIGC